MPQQNHHHNICQAVILQLDRTNENYIFLKMYGVLPITNVHVLYKDR